MGRVMQGLVSDLATDPHLAEAFQTRVVTLRVAEVRRLVERGIERGDLRRDTDVELVHELLFGPVYYRLLLSGAPLEPGLAERIVDAVLPAIAMRRKRALARLGEGQQARGVRDQERLDVALGPAALPHPHRHMLDDVPVAVAAVADEPVLRADVLGDQELARQPAATRSPTTSRRCASLGMSRVVSG